MIGVWRESPGDINRALESMISALRHRGPSSAVEIIESGDGRKAAIGCVFHPSSEYQIARSRTTVVAFNGSFYDENRKDEPQYLLRQIHGRSFRAALRTIIRHEGGFVGLFARSGELCGFRDINGSRPLYYASSRHTTAFASERKALWKIGFLNPQPVPPGCAVNATHKGLVRIRIDQYPQIRPKKLGFEYASATLHRLLLRSTRRITRGAENICVAFSGGLDSALTAVLARKAGVRVQLVSVGLTGSSELSTAAAFAEELNLPITTQQFESTSIEEYVRRVLWLIEEPNLMKLSVAIPLHWAAMVAARCNCNVMLCGQGSDELYGGYSKYARTLETKGRKALINQLYRSLVESSQVNYDRDDQTISPFPIELRTPFADSTVIKFSLAIPLEFKVKDGNDATRKWVLRAAARRAGLPEDIVWRRKKAIQHGTGVEKAILKLAKSHGLKPDQYLNEIFTQVRAAESMP